MIGWTRMISFVPRLVLASLIVLGCESREQGTTPEPGAIDQDAPRQQPSGEVDPAQVEQPDEADPSAESAQTAQTEETAENVPMPAEESPAEENAASEQEESAQVDSAQEQPAARDSLIQGTMRGTVRAIDLARGKVTVEGGGQQAELQAHPSDLALLELGEEVALSFESYSDGSQWLATRGNTRQMLQRSASVGQLSGEVEAIDVDAGILAVAGQTFRAHPDQLQDIDAGDAVTFSYADVEETPWVAELDVGAAMASVESPVGEQAQAQVQTQAEGEDAINWYFEPSG